MVLHPYGVDDVHRHDRNVIKAGDRGMSRMLQRESLKVLESLLSRSLHLTPLIGVKELYMTTKEDEGVMWHIHVSNNVFEGLTEVSMKNVFQSDNEADGPLVKRVSMQTANHITLFTIYELGAEKN